MNIRVKILCGIFMMLALLMVSSCAPRKYVPKANEELYGTWINDRMATQKTVIFSGGFKDYLRISDTDPYEEGTEQIDTTWKDSNGTVWYKAFGTYTSGGEHPGLKYQWTRKISKSGTILEFMLNPVVEFDPKKYPTELDPNNVYYCIYHRATE